MRNEFFDEPLEQSIIKREIVTKYFDAWRHVITPVAKRRSGKIGYIDLFSGPGRYADGSESTPLVVLRRAIGDPDLRQMLLTLFVDADHKTVENLRSAIAQLPGIETLVHQPQILEGRVEEGVVQALLGGVPRLIPTLLFVDPYGYKGLSRDLISTILSHWGCDAIFFFNYNRINAAINNPAVAIWVEAIYGSERLSALRTLLPGKRPHEREALLLEALTDALGDIGGQYVLPFCFKREDGLRTSHYLVFVTKHVRGYEIMKDIMARESSQATQGVPSFQYCPAGPECPRLFELSRPLDDLASMLLQDFAGRSLTRRELFEQHHIGKPYVAANYRDVLMRLEAEGVIRCSPPADKRKARTMAETVTVRFPRRA